MSITLVLHEATRTGAPRVGGLIAKELAKELAKAEDVHVIVLKDGPLTPWLRDLLGDERLTVLDGAEFEFRVPFEERLAAAAALLEKRPDDLVYVNSLAASVFVLAAKAAGRRAVIHVHEKADEIVHLMRHVLTKIEVMSVADGAVLAAGDLFRDVLDVFGMIPAKTVDFGIAIDIDAVREQAAETPTPALNAAGEPFAKGERLVVGMCGHASPRKGSDIFLGVAEAAPDCDFLWVGGWSPEESIENLAYEDFVAKKPPNLYVAGAVDNPYAHIGQMDLFFLSSREDPNPLVLAEAMALRVPLLCFSKTTAVANRLGRSAILCHGLPNVEDATRVIKACAPEHLRSEAFRALSDPWISSFDLKEKMRDIMDLIENIRAADEALSLEISAEVEIAAADSAS
ncbi:glycosyltransferase [Rhodoblastus acidophilus]|uniref:Glycosyltransferase n=1 Tax=Candidatus Rhodoblastus alkanivorans TaxID=2954117 RepID=A0ABS9Z696_9HYPH|nr:glycosyltransferase [Candidatus Rhodoblastus alkanivorans]MCI4680293.1 glycosyltransferase [Candidatus Rhodoblastus alkanivorans]MCI4683112.1 glycosyltransferase [Candidatus Rhodoblastus alkanivorans]MDI4640423.1 glycosyltransferase [Rhodoblastus acidophilus]